MDPRNDAQLRPPDIEALDALVEAGFEVDRVPEGVRARARRLAALLGALETPVVRSNDALVARTLDGVRAVRGLTEDTLCPADAAAMDALIAAEYRPERVGDSLRQRASRLASLGEAITHGPRSRENDLTDRAFGLVMLAADRPLATIDPARPAGVRIRWAEIGSLAAMLLIGASVIVPVLGAARQRQVRGSCSANLGSVATALSSYASAYRDALPMAAASMGGPWWDVGSGPGHSNSANLFTLARTGFAKVRDLACPGNAHASVDAPGAGAVDWPSIDRVSYSYQIMFGPARPGWKNAERTAVLADRSPIVLRSRAGQNAIPTENSPNHARCGQSILFSDGSITWQSTPVLPDGDNIWLPWQVEEILRRIGAGEPITLEGVEVPGSEHDAFLAP